MADTGPPGGGGIGNGARLDEQFQVHIPEAVCIQVCEQFEVSGNYHVRSYTIKETFTEEFIAKYLPPNVDAVHFNPEQIFKFTKWLRGTASVTQLSSKSTLIEFRDKKHGKFFFFVENAELVKVINNGKLFICMKRQDVIANSTVMVHYVVPNMCVQCCKLGDEDDQNKLPVCKGCAMHAAKIFYCSKECQRMHWPTHKRSCFGEKST